MSHFFSLEPYIFHILAVPSWWAICLVDQVLLLLVGGAWIAYFSLGKAVDCGMI